MWQAFIIVLREGVEGFLIVAITLAYLNKTGQGSLAKAVYWGILGAFAASGLLGYGLWLTEGANQPLWEGIFASVTVVLVTTLVVHMWRVGPQMKREMETHLDKATHKETTLGAVVGVFVFTLLMISREGMETALLLFQIQEPQIVTGIILGIIGAGSIAFLWERFGYLVNMRHFFQVTAVYLLLFTAQIAFQAFHEFTEAGVLPNSEYLHKMSEPFSTAGIYGKTYTMITVIGCGLWLVGAWVGERLFKSKDPASVKEMAG